MTYKTTLNPKYGAKLDKDVYKKDSINDL